MVQKNEHLLDTYIFWRISKRKNSKKIPQFNPENAKANFQISLTEQIAKIPELNIKNENGQKAVHFHALRKFFRTNVGNVCGRDYAEALMGHSFYMDTYYQLPEDKKKQMYLDAESQLTILDSKAIETSLNNLSKKYENLETKMNGIVSYLKNNSIPIPNF